MKHPDPTAARSQKVNLSPRQREILLHETFASPTYAERPFEVAADGNLLARYTRDELEDLLGHVAAAANHATDKGLQKELEALYDRLSERVD